MKRPWWYIAGLLTLLAILMASHLAILGLTAWDCDRYARILFDKLEAGEIQEIQATNAECNIVEETFADAAGQYIAVILALLSGAGFAATRRREE